MSDISKVVGDIVNDGNFYRVKNASSVSGVQLGSNAANAFDELCKHMGESVLYADLSKTLGLSPSSVKGLMGDVSTMLNESSTHAVYCEGTVNGGFARLYEI